MKTALSLLLFASALFAQDHNRRENRALLGVVSLERKKKVIIGHVLDRSPAAAAKLQAGDVLESIAGRPIRRHTDVDAALRSAQPDQAVKVTFRRGGKRGEKEIRLIARRSYAGKFLQRRRAGETGFAAPPWHAFAWAHLAKGRKPPSLENTRGKVVVLHAFQCW